jgi:hypothetical protein
LPCSGNNFFANPKIGLGSNMTKPSKAIALILGFAWAKTDLDNKLAATLLNDIIISP